MPTKKFINITDAPAAPDSNSFMIGTKDIGAGASIDYKYTADQVAAGVAPSLAAPITCSTTGDTITDAYFSNTIRFIVLGGQFRTLAGGDFSQAGTTITLLGGATVLVGDIIVAFI